MAPHKQRANYDEPFMNFNLNPPFFPTSQVRQSSAPNHSQLDRNTMASFEQQGLSNDFPDQAQNHYQEGFMTNQGPSPQSINQLSSTSSGIAPPRSFPNQHLQGTLHYGTEVASHSAFKSLVEQRTQPLPADASMMSYHSSKGKQRHLEQHEVSSDNEETKLELNQDRKASAKRRKITRVTLKTSVAFRPTESVQEVLGADFEDVSFGIEGALAFAGRIDKDEATRILEIYKRNTFVIDNCHYWINASASARQGNLTLHHPAGTHRPITEFALKITAHQVQEGAIGQEVGLEQFSDPKRKFKQTPQARLLAPIASEDGLLELSWPSLIQNTSSKFCQWERVSFKKATEHNGDRRSDQTYSCICLSLIAYVPKVNASMEKEEVVVARRSTPGFVVYARSPSGLRKNDQSIGERKNVEDSTTGTPGAQTTTQSSSVKIKREFSSDAWWPSSASPTYETSPIVEQTLRRSMRLQVKDETPTTYAHSPTESSAPTSAYPSTGFSASLSSPAMRSEASPLIPGQNDFTSFDDLLNDFSEDFWNDNGALFGEQTGEATEQHH